MFQKFDEESQKVLLCAKKEMQELKHDYVGTEHLLLAILNSDNDIRYMLNKSGINYDNFKNRLIDIVGIGNSDNDLFLYTPLVKRVLEYSINDAREHNDNVSVSNIFYSILEEGEGVAIRVLLSLDIDMDKLYNSILRSIPKKNGKRKSILSEIGINLNDKASNNLIDPVIGRDKEINRMIEILCRRTKNNPILIGDAGVGKTAIVEHLASKIVNGDVPEVLKNKKIISLDMASSVAGTKYRGEFEDRMKNILSELEDNEDIILFIDEIHTIIGAGGAEGAIDASNIFKPALARGKMRCIGATTIDEYKKYIENDGALDRRFQKLEIKEPDSNTIKNILMKLKDIYQIHHNVHVSEKMIDKIIYYSNKYIKDRNEPDKSIDILDEVCSKVSLKTSSSDVKLKKLKSNLMFIINNKNNLIVNNDFKMAYKLKEEEDKINSLINNLELKKVNRIKNVTEKDIIDVIKSKTDIPILNIDDDYLLNIKNSLNDKIFGQRKQIDELVSITKRLVNFNSFSILLCGPSSVGKSTLAKEYGKLIFGDNVIKLDMNEFTESHSISKIIGAPPGYVGYDTKNVLDDIKSKPNCVLILDEIEKCHRSVLKLFLQGIKEGYVKDSRGRIISFSNVILIITTNIEISNKSLGFTKSNNLGNKLKSYFGTEFINSISKIIVLDSLSIDTVKEIINKNITLLENKYNVSISLSDDLINSIIDLSEYNVFGIKKLKEIIKYNIEDIVIDNILNNNKDINIDSLSMVTI